MARIDALLQELDDKDAVLHLSAGAAPQLRRRGGAQPVPGHEDVLSDEALRDLLREAVPEEALRSLAQAGHAACVYCRGEARYELHLYEIAGGLLCTARALPLVPAALLGTLRALCGERRGLVLCAGPPGAAIGALPAALIDALDEGPPRHVVAFGRSPLSVRARRSLVARGGTHTDAADAVRAAAQQGADVLLLDPLPLQALPSLIAAAAGALVVGTLEAPGSIEAVERCGGALCPADPALGRRRLGAALRGLLTLRPCPGADGATVLAAEVLLGGPGLAEVLARGEHALAAHLAAGRHRGMLPLDDSLTDLVTEGRLLPQVAYLFARDKRRFPSPFGSR